MRAGEEGAGDAESAGVALERGGSEVDDEEGDDEGEEGVDTADRGHHDCGFVGWSFGRV